MPPNERESDPDAEPGDPDAEPGDSDEDSERSDPPRSLTLGQHALAFVKELFIVVVGAIIVASLLRGFVGQMFLIPSSSMENTLMINDRVAVEKISSVKRGQVVVFADPGGWLSGPPADERGPVGRAFEFIGVLPGTGTEHLIKRVIGMPGDEVVCCDAKGRIVVNDQPLDETGYLYKGTDGVQADPSDIPFSVVVPRNRIFVMGDHRNSSRDSRCHLNDEQPGKVKGDNAFISLDRVVGRGVAVVWPLDLATRLKIPATFETVPPGLPSPPAQPKIEAGPEANC